MWSKLDDAFPDHPKIQAAGPTAAWLFVCGLCYCNRLLTDGFIPLSQARRLADIDDPDAAIRMLVDVGLWQRIEGGYAVHDFLAYNPTRGQVKRVQLDRQRAGSKGGQAKWKQTASKPEAEMKQTGSKVLGVCLPSATPVASNNCEAKSNPDPGPCPYPYQNPDQDPKAATSAAEVDLRSRNVNGAERHPLLDRDAEPSAIRDANNRIRVKLKQEGYTAAQIDAAWLIAESHAAMHDQRVDELGNPAGYVMKIIEGAKTKTAAMSDEEARAARVRETMAQLRRERGEE
jgi:hypothetical protein